MSPVAENQNSEAITREDILKLRDSLPTTYTVRRIVSRRAREVLREILRTP